MSLPPWGVFRSHLPGRPEGGPASREEADVAPARSAPAGGWPAGVTSVLLCPLQELVEFYQKNSLKDCFKSLDTTLQFPFKEPERRAISKPAGRRPRAGGLRRQLCFLMGGRFGGTLDVPCSGHAEARPGNQREPLPLPWVPLLLAGLRTHLLAWKAGQGLLLYLGRRRHQEPEASSPVPCEPMFLYQWRGLVSIHSLLPEKGEPFRALFNSPFLCISHPPYLWTLYKILDIVCYEVK